MSKISHKLRLPCYFEQQQEEVGREVYSKVQVLERTKQTMRLMYLGSTKCQVISEPQDPSYEGEGDVYYVTVHWLNDSEIEGVNVQRLTDPKSAEQSYWLDLVYTTVC
eukprot:3231475-Rhodomonas_salina.1